MIATGADRVEDEWRMNKDRKNIQLRRIPTWLLIGHMPLVNTVKANIYAIPLKPIIS